MPYKTVLRRVGLIKEKEITFWVQEGKSKAHERVVRGLKWQFPFLLKDYSGCEHKNMHMCARILSGSKIAWTSVCIEEYKLFPQYLATITNRKDSTLQILERILGILEK